MKKRWVTLGVFIIAAAGYTVASNLKSEETVVSARYRMLACEKCYHMTVEKSRDANLLGETIVPVSKTIDIEKIIDGVALTGDPLCLRGRPYMFNPNPMGIEPGGMRFEVLAQESSETCAKL